VDVEIWGRRRRKRRRIIAEEIASAFVHCAYPKVVK